jgi:hypothetical protein
MQRNGVVDTIQKLQTTGIPKCMYQSICLQLLHTPMRVQTRDVQFLTASNCYHDKIVIIS